MLPHLRVENCVSENVCELSKFTELVRGMVLGSGDGAGIWAQICVTPLVTPIFSPSLALFIF